MNPDFEIERTSLLPAIQMDLGGSALPTLAGSSVRFQMKALRGPGLVLNAAASIVSPASPQTVAYAWQSGDTDVAGLYLAQFVVTAPDGRAQYFPNPGYLVIRIGADLATL